MSNRRRPKANNAEHAIAATLDRKAAKDGIADIVEPILLRALKERWSPERLRAHPEIALLIEARKISIAIQDPSTSTALAAIKDFTDRKEGKPKESLDVTSRLEKAPDEQLDATLKSLLGSASDDESEPAAH